MFKGSKNVEPEAHTSMLASVGGQSNAYTTDDETVFWETVPAQYLPLSLWLEADRMATLRIDKDTFANERDVVKEERRMRIDNQPYGRLNEIIYDQAFTVHPYKHATIGSMEDLEAASVEDVRDFYKTFYVPENATLVIVGDFETAQALTLVNNYLGRVPKSDRVGAARHPAGAAADEGEAGHAAGAVAAAGRRRRLSRHQRRQPRFVSAAHRREGAVRRPDARASTRSWSTRQQMAVAAFGNANLIEDPNLFYAVAIVQPGHTPEEVGDALIAELDRLKTEPITAHELQRAKNQFARDYIMGRESDQQKAGQLSHAVVIHNDIKTADGEFDIFQNMTVADVQRVAKTYFSAGEPAGADADAVGKGGAMSTQRVEHRDGCHRH